MSQDILSFIGPNKWLSNFWICDINYDNLSFTSVEAAYVSAKNHNLLFKKNVSKMTPWDAKRYGRVVTLRPDWDSVRLQVMEELLRQKFAPTSDLAKRLCDTQDAKLIEGNTWNDTFWGVCGGYGENNLGKLLMKIREDLK